MTLPDSRILTESLDTTWPPAATWRVGPFTLSDGAGGGKRVSSATTETAAGRDDITRAASAMGETGAARLFRLDEASADLDSILADQGYQTVDPTLFYASEIGTLLNPGQRPLDAIAAETRLGIQAEIWEQGGIGAPRLAIMDRVTVPKTWLLARLNDRAAGTAFLGIHNNLAMIHAIEVLPRARRQGAARAMIHRAAKWATERGATHLGLAVTAANEPANALYASLGMRQVGKYHYRIHPDDMT